MNQSNMIKKSIIALIIFTIICGAIYTLLITAFAQLVFPAKANGSIVKVDGKKYGAELLAQQFTDEKYMWGRVMILDLETFKDESGNPLMYAKPSNISPASEEYEKIVSERVKKIKSSNKDMGDTPIPVDLVTVSGSGLDPHISESAANYQIKRISKENNIPEKEVKDMINKCSKGKFLGIFGEKTVNVLKFNLMLEDIL